MATAEQLLENGGVADAGFSDEEQASSALKTEQDIGNPEKESRMSLFLRLIALRFQRKQSVAKTLFAITVVATVLMIGVYMASSSSREAELSHKGNQGKLADVGIPSPAPEEEPASTEAGEGELDVEVSGPAAGGFTDGFCGISSNPSLCARDVGYLNELTTNGSRNIFCKEYGGSDACTFTMDDTNGGLDKDPRECQWSPGVIFLWDQPDSGADETGRHDGEFGSSQCGSKPCEVWAAETWIKYVDKWHSQLTFARSMGVRVTTPRFQGRSLLDKFAKFFAACPECSRKGSRYYIDILAFNAYVDNLEHNNAGMAANVTWIKNIARNLKKAYANRPVALSDFGSFGGQSASLQAEVIEHSGLFQREGNEFDAVYYFAAVNFKTVHNFLNDVVESGPRKGVRLGQVLLDACSSALN